MNLLTKAEVVYDSVAKKFRASKDGGRHWADLGSGQIKGPYSFAHDSPGITTGLDLGPDFSPGDVILGGWFQGKTAWDGEYDNNGIVVDGTALGLYNYLVSAYDPTQTPTLPVNGGGALWGEIASGPLSGMTHVTDWASQAIIGAQGSFPAVVQEAGKLKVSVAVPATIGETLMYVIVDKPKA